MTQIETGRPRPDEVASCLTLLPQAAAFRPALMVARRGGDVVGAAGLLWQSWSEPAGFPLMLHVADAHRRQGAGRALVEAAATLAAGETDGLWAADPVPDGEAAAAFLDACGFRVMRRQFEYDVSVDAGAALMQPTLDRLREGRWPADAVVRPLSTALLPDVAAVMGPSFGKPPASLLALWRSDPAALDMALSGVLLVAGTVVGAMLVGSRGDIPVIEAMAVTPRHRGGSGAALLLAHAVGCEAARDVRTVRFRCEEDARMPMAIAQAARGVPVAARGWWFRPLDA